MNPYIPFIILIKLPITANETTDNIQNRSIHDHYNRTELINYVFAFNYQRVSEDQAEVPIVFDAPNTESISNSTHHNNLVK